MYSEKQEKHLHIRVSNSDYEKVKKSAELYGLSMGQYAKKIILKSRLKQPKFAYSDARRIQTELNYIGNNLNQYTKALNITLKHASETSSENMLFLQKNCLQMLTMISQKLKKG
ncbi:mobilization protein [Ligilactobacillus acidipiscis]|uniref:plasmid mobilization protein n=1 Tax=Ligilactobacillus acidipiscis TaxID=89059 RepID=UPI000A26647A|nr:mobilization protein [Ligilactobacillus acidipiscis]